MNTDIDYTVLEARFVPSQKELEDGILVKNACECTVCGGPADRHAYLFVCQKNPAHFADLTTGIFDDHSPGE